MTPTGTGEYSTTALPPLERRNCTLAELAAAQGVHGPQHFDALFGAGADLWDDAADFEAFQASLRGSRHDGD